MQFYQHLFTSVIRRNGTTHKRHGLHSFDTIIMIHVIPPSHATLIVREDETPIPTDHFKLNNRF